MKEVEFYREDFRPTVDEGDYFGIGFAAYAPSPELQQEVQRVMTEEAAGGFGNQFMARVMQAAEVSA